MQINMTVNQRAHPPIVSPDEWLAERKTLLGSEKEFTKHKDRLNAQRRRLPMARVEKTYGFDGPDGKRSLDLIRFGGQVNYAVWSFLLSSFQEKNSGCGACGKVRSLHFSIGSTPSWSARRSKTAGLICPIVE